MDASLVAVQSFCAVFCMSKPKKPVTRSEMEQREQQRGALRKRMLMKQFEMNAYSSVSIFASISVSICSLSFSLSLLPSPFSLLPSPFSLLPSPFSRLPSPSPSLPLFLFPSFPPSLSPSLALSLSRSLALSLSLSLSRSLSLSLPPSLALSLSHWKSVNRGRKDAGFTAKCMVPRPFYCAGSH